jgi:hypothetical protein
MKGLTLSEISKILNIPVNTLRQRITRAGVKPLTKEAVYADSVLETIRNVKPVGWPKKPETRTAKKPVQPRHRSK